MSRQKIQPLIIVPDTHGHLSKVEQLVEHCRKKGYLQDHKFLFLGDYVDRGPDVRGLLDLLVQLHSEGHHFIMGNHEYVLMKALYCRDEKVIPQWRTRWANRYEADTLESYGINVHLPHNVSGEALHRVLVELHRVMPEAHKQFLWNLPLWYEQPGLIGIHAGLNMDNWEDQKAAMVKMWKDDAAPDGPEQIFSSGLAESLKTPLKNCVVVSGHSFRDKPLYLHKKRLLLHCGIDVYGPLYAWLSGTTRLIRIEGDPILFNRTPFIIK
jgi:hypothetical protein